ncbi:MAG: hypothetical protein OT477_12895 [Chloroflexi bacterium]|nr:hypothetical protein [Chloroflexota bacterium]
MKKVSLLGWLVVAICFGLLGGTAEAAPGAWGAVANMNVVRENHTLTLLPDGQLLAAGGFAFGGSTYSSAELYNPTSNSWTATANMGTVRHSHSATLLPNGLVLVAGGGDTSGTDRASAELYNPATGTWSPTGSMTQARQLHKAIRLLDGRVLVIGGSANFVPQTSAEIYDPATGTWSSAGTMSTGRNNPAAALLRDGRVIVLGGFSGGELNSYQIYDPSTNSWGAVGTMNDPRNGPTATVLSNGQLLVAGGSNAFPNTNTKTELFNPSDNSWAYTTGDLSTPRQGHSAHLLPNGQVLVAGGSGGTALTTAELFTRSLGTWAATGSMVGNRANAQFVALADGRVLASGGFDISSFASLNTAEIYEPTLLNRRCGVGTGVHNFQTDAGFLNVTISSLGDIDCLTVRRMEITHPNATGNMATGIYWQINATNAGNNPASGYTLSLTIPHAYGTDTGVQACRYPGGLGGFGWDCTNSQTANTTHVSVTGVTQLSDWVVGQDLGPTAVAMQTAGQRPAVVGVWWLVGLFGIVAATFGVWRRMALNTF